MRVKVDNFDQDEISLPSHQSLLTLRRCFVGKVITRRKKSRTESKLDVTGVLKYFLRLLNNFQ